MVDDRDTHGRFTQRHADAEVLAAVRTHEPAATSEVADELGIVRQSADYRLRRLEEEGRVASKKIAASLVWFITDEKPAGDDTAASGSSPARGAADVDASPGDGGGDHAVHTPEPQMAGEYGPGDAEPAFLDAPQTVDREAALAAVDAIREYLRENGPASKREVVLEVMPDHSLGYDVPDLEPGERYRGSWWRYVIRPALEAVDDVEYRNNNADYQYVGEKR
jgi:predicted transcriptional regulator